MYILYYYKKSGRWFLDRPSHAPWLKTEELERRDEFFNFLELASEGESKVTFYFDTKPFKDGGKCLRLEVNEKEAVYEIEELDGKPLNLRVRLNKTIFVFSDHFPETIYIRKWPVHKALAF